MDPGQISSDLLDLVRSSHSLRNTDDLSRPTLSHDENSNDQYFESETLDTGYYFPTESKPARSLSPPKAPKDTRQRFLVPRYRCVFCPKICSRLHSLKLHHKDTHAPYATATATATANATAVLYYCDYAACSRRIHPFAQKREFLLHVYDAHKEPTGSRGYNTKDKSNKSRRDWWRCSGCLLRNYGTICIECSFASAFARIRQCANKVENRRRDGSAGAAGTVYKAPEIRLLDTAGSPVSATPLDDTQPLSPLPPPPLPPPPLSPPPQLPFPEQNSSRPEWWHDVTKMLAKLNPDDNRMTLHPDSCAVSSFATSTCGESMSICIENTPDIVLDDHIPPKTQQHALCVLLDSFARTRGATGFKDYGAGTGGGARAGRQSDSSLHRPSQSRSRRSSNEQSKRKWGGGDDENDNGEGSGRKRTPKGKGNAGGSGESRRLLACPYYKWKPLSYKSCRSRVLDEVHRVRDHLFRSHIIPIHCAICYTEFAETKERDVHYRAQACAKQPEKEFECMCPETEKKIRKRVNQRLSQQDQWNEMYRTLFPGAPVPASPYLCDGLVSDELHALQEYMTQQWPVEYRRFISPGLPIELLGHEDILQAFTTSLFEQAIERILQRAEGRRENIPVSDSEDTSFVSVPLPLTTTISASSSDPQMAQPEAANPTPMDESPLEMDTGQQQNMGDFYYYAAHVGTGAGNLPQFDPWAPIPDEEYIDPNNAG